MELCYFGSVETRDFTTSLEVVILGSISVIEMQDFGMNKIPDGAKWTEADYDEMSEMLDEL